MQEALLQKIRSELAGIKPDRRGVLLRQLSDLYIARLGQIDGDLVDLFVDIAMELLGPSSLFERMAFSNAIADFGVAPPRLLDHILRDVYLVARPLIERGAMTESRLLQLMDADKRELTYLMIAQRPKTGIPITDRLVHEGSMKVLLAVAANPAAKLSPASFEKLGNLAITQRDMDAALSHRADLPAAIAKRLHREVSRSSATRVADMMAKDAAKRRSSLVLRG